MMTLEQVNNKFKDAKVKFNSYYKYTFNFVGETEDGFKLICGAGGDASDIYRFSVDNTTEMSFRNADEWSRVTIKDSNGEIVFNEYFGW